MLYFLSAVTFATVSCNVWFIIHAQHWRLRAVRMSASSPRSTPGGTRRRRSVSAVVIAEDAECRRSPRVALLNTTKNATNRADSTPSVQTAQEQQLWLPSLLRDYCGLADSPADADGAWAGCCLPVEQYSVIYSLSWLSLCTGVYCLYRQGWPGTPTLDPIAAAPFGVWLTSLLYWHRPNYGWRRTFDIAYVQAALWYQLYRAWQAGGPAWHGYLTITLVGMACYLLGQYCRYTLGSVWASTLLHCMVHILGNAGNILLYSYALYPPAALDS